MPLSRKRTSVTFEKPPLFSNARLCKLIIPLILEQLLAVMVGMADTMMVSSAGEAAVSGVSLVDEIMILMINIFSALGTGGAIVVGYAIGQKDHTLAGRTAEQSIILVTGCSLVIAGLLYAAQGFVLHTVFGSIAPDVEQSARIYYNIVAASVPFIALYNAGAAIFRVMGNSAISMRISLLMNGINLAGNAILIYGFQMGAEGVAIPTLVSRMVAAILIICLLFKQKETLPIQFANLLRPNDSLILRILRMGIPNGLENGIFQFGKIMTVSIVSIFPTAALSAHAVSGKITTLQLMAGAAVGLGLITVVSQCLGAGAPEQAKYYTKKMLGIATLLNSAVVFLTWLALPLIPSLFHMSEEAAELMTKIVLLHGAGVLSIWSLAWSLPNALRAAGDVRFTMIISITSMWIFRVGLGYLLGVVWQVGVFGIWIAMLVDWLFRAICFLIRYLSNRWLRQKV